MLTVLGVVKRRVLRLTDNPRVRPRSLSASSPKQPSADRERGTRVEVVHSQKGGNYSKMKDLGELNTIV